MPTTLQAPRALSAGVSWLARSPWRLFPLLFLFSLLPRLNDLQQTPREELLPNANRELGAIAISLMQTGKFADPYCIPTGPTAHLPPVYPVLISIIYRLFGLTATAGYVSRLLIAITVSVLYGLLPWVGAQVGVTWQAGLIAGVAAAVRHEEWHDHGEYLGGVVLGLLLVAFLLRWTKPPGSWWSSLFLGLAVGAALHLQPALLPIILALFAFEFWWGKNHRSLASLGVCAIGIVVACIPWGWRNYKMFHAVFFIRSNLGLELRMGNHEGAAATIETMDAEPGRHYLHPTLLPVEAARLRELGEFEYMQRAGEDAREWIKSNPHEFLSLVAQRFANVWGVLPGKPLLATEVEPLTIWAIAGLILALRSLATPQRAILVIPLVMYPIVYYFVAYMPRYRVPIDWILFLLAGYVVWRGSTPFSRERSAALAGRATAA